MAWKTILTVITDPAQAGAQLESAVRLAAREDAHLEVLCLGVDRMQAGYYDASGTAFLVQEAIEHATSDARALEAAVRKRLEGEALRWSVEAVVTQLGAIGAIVGLRARYADLTVIVRPFGEDAPVDAERLIEAAMFEGDCPVLVVPAAGLADDMGRRPLVAWNQSAEALAAIRAALPLLQRAEAVEIAVIDPPTSGPERSDPGGPVGQMLNRHGVRAEIAVLAKTQPRISEVLARRATDIGASLIVMGAYGHSRFREAILGGATRNMLQTAQLPLLMAR